MEIVEMIEKAGVVGAGGAGFPTAVKLDAKANCYIVNAVECEPLIASDKYLCRTHPKEILFGALTAAKAIEASRIVIALKKTYHAEIQSLEKAIAETKAPVELFKLAPFYPAGDEQTLVHAILKKSIPEGGLPLDVGAVVNNVASVYNIGQAMQGKAVTHKILSIVGEVAKPVVLTVPIGTALTDCLRRANPLLKEYAVIIGGPMMGRIVTEKESLRGEVVTKTTGNLLVLPPDHYLVRHAVVPIQKLKKQAMTACLQCRMCTDLCPRHNIGHRIDPHIIMRNAFKENLLDDETYLRAFGEAINCCSCGVCEMYACPMGLSPKRMNDYFKGQLRAKGLRLERNQSPQAIVNIEHRRIPTERLIARLGLSRYENQKVTPVTVESKKVKIPLSLHIGAPAVCVVKKGDAVSCGTLIGEKNGKISANIHSSIDGVVVQAEPDYVEIRKGEAK